MIQSVRGTKDLLPGTTEKWQYIEEILRKVSNRFCYNEIRTPIFELTNVFTRSIGDGTDIVNKEMYSFTDRGGENITLRPEGTAGMVRAIVQNNLMNLSQINRLWYYGSFFRYERPQKGRLRQFHQYGAECIGSAFPESDLEIISLAVAIFESFNITDYKILINTLGDNEVRQNYRNSLVEYLKNNYDRLSKDSQNRIDTNPLRVLDSKDEKDSDIISNAPTILNYLNNESADHFEKLKKLLDDQNINYEIQPRLVRGLDYYNHTVFEFQSSLLGAQDSFGGGGRYNGLLAEFGGKETPAVGFALGIERIIMILENSNNFPELEHKPDFFIISTEEKFQTEVQKLAIYLRSRGYDVSSDLIRRSIKAKFREAGRIKAKNVIVIGENELEKGSFTLKNMETGEQYDIKIEDMFNLKPKI